MKKLSLLPVLLLAMMLYACGPSGDDQERTDQEADSIAKQMLEEIKESEHDEFDHDHDDDMDHDHDHDGDAEHDHDHDHDGDSDHDHDDEL